MTQPGPSNVVQPDVQIVRVALVDDHPLFRQGLRELLAKEVDLEIIADLGNALDVIDLASRSPLELAIIDLILPSTNGVAVTQALKRSQPTCKILGLSMLDEPTRIAEMMRAGADGFALKTQPPAEIIGAIRAVLAGQRYLPAGISADQVTMMIESDDAWPLRRLTHREREIFELLVSGRSNDDIASMLFIAKRTVETHRQHIMKKVGARSLVELIRIGMKHGVVTTVA
jgi:DNA-binding NarL/FixJ family response regulator